MQPGVYKYFILCQRTYSPSEYSKPVVYRKYKGLLRYSMVLGTGTTNCWFNITKCWHTGCGYPAMVLYPIDEEHCLTRTSSGKVG